MILRDLLCDARFLRCKTSRRFARNETFAETATRLCVARSLRREMLNCGIFEPRDFSLESFRGDFWSRDFSPSVRFVAKWIVRYFEPFGNRIFGQFRFE